MKTPPYVSPIVTHAQTARPHACYCGVCSALLKILKGRAILSLTYIQYNTSAADRPYSLHLSVLLQYLSHTYSYCGAGLLGRKVITRPCSTLSQIHTAAAVPSVQIVTYVSKWQVEMGWPDIHWLAWDKGGLVAAVLSLT
jgi:hypothetical protein